MSDRRRPDNSLDLLVSLRRASAFNERHRFILLFLVINALILILVWFSWHSQMLIREKRSLEIQKVAAETQVVEKVIACEIHCSDTMSTLVARQRTAGASMRATLETPITCSPATGTPTDIPTWTPSSLLTAKWTPTPAPMPLSSLLILGIASAAIVQGSGHAFVTIIGQSSVSGVTAWLGVNIPIAVTANTGTVITGTPSPNIPIGTYDLTVIDPDGQYSTLGSALSMQESD